MIGAHLQLQQTPPEPASYPSPVQVISWDPSRPWRGPAHQPAELGSPLYLQGQLWGPHHLSLGVWYWGSQPAYQLVVRQAGLRLRLIRSYATKHPLAPSGLICRPRRCQHRGDQWLRPCRPWSSGGWLPCNPPPSWRQNVLLAPCGDCLPWTDRLGTRFLGRCPGSNQVRSVPTSSDERWTIPL